MIVAPAPTPLISVLMGDVKTASAPHRLRTILGSCVGIALYDSRRHIGSLAHIVLPSANGRATPATQGKFADTAIPLMIDQLRALAKGEVKLSAKLTGGAAMFGVGSQTNNIGLQNKQAVEKLLKELGIPVLGHDLGGEKGRRVTFDLSTGEVCIEVQDVEAVRI